MKYEIELPEFDEYEPTGEYREPEIGDYFIGDGEKVIRCTSEMCESIIMKKKKWVPKERELIFKIHSNGNIYEGQYIGLSNKEEYDFGVIFPTREQAEHARDKLKELLNNL
jgi:hypothetical protein